MGVGVRYFDVAPSYGVGLAEMRLGRALRRAADEHDTPVPVARDDVFVSTKVSPPSCVPPRNNASLPPSALRVPPSSGA